MNVALSIQTAPRKRLILAGLLFTTALAFMLLLYAGMNSPAARLPVALVATVWFALLAFVVPEAALIVYVVAAVCTMSFEFLVLRGKSVSGGIFLSQVLLVVLLISSLIRSSVYRIKLQQRNMPLPLLLPLVGLALVPFLSVFSAYVDWNPEVPTLHRKLVVQLAGATLVLLAAAAVLLVAAIVKKVSLAKIIIAIMVAIAILSFLDMFGLAYTPGRSLMYTVSPIAFSFALHAESRLKRLLWLSLLVPPIFMAVSTIKITLIVAALVPLLVISAGYSRRALLITVASFVLGYLLLGLIIGGSPFGAAYAKAVRVSDFDRIPLFQKAVSTWAEHPVFGVGPGGQFAYLDGEHYYGTTHSLYGNFLMETGFVGIFFLLWTIAAAIALGRAAYLHKYELPPATKFHAADRRFVRAFVLGQTGGFIGMVVAGIFSDTLLPAIQNAGMYMFGASVYLWMLLGITIALRRIQLEERAATGDAVNLHT